MRRASHPKSAGTSIFVNGQHLETVIGLLSQESLKGKVQKWLTM
jgi:hypothetical protein